MDHSHTARMAAAQNAIQTPNLLAFRAQTNCGLQDGFPAPSEDVLDKFWRQVAKLTTRYHDVDRKWIGGDEIRKWNNANRFACQKCSNSKTGKTCVVDEDQPSCRTCRSNKLGCDRKQLFVYEYTKDDFFSSYAQFLSVFRNKEPGRLRRYERVKRQNKPKARVMAQTTHESRINGAGISKKEHHVPSGLPPNQPVVRGINGTYW
ncbi:hypothetical protein C8R47DRAFT_1324304 [Mycena vitilis]|nr:hypothetical protein C8R47DRAFT_1324304 [Mycena vitilis]